MRENRTSYPPGKTQMLQQLQTIPNQYKVMAIIRLDKVRSVQILPLRKKLKDEVRFFALKNNVAKKALDSVDIPGMKQLAAGLGGQCMFMFTNMSPFKLNVLLGKNAVMIFARGGDAASVDVVVPAVNTGVAPGPMLTEFKEANIPTKIDQGTIWITKETTPVKQGETISPKLAPLLAKLDIKSVKAGILLESALEAGVVFSSDQLMVDVDAVRDSIATLHQEAITLTIETGYITPDNISQILAKASRSAISLSVESGHPTKQTINSILQRADAQARAIASRAG